MSGQQGVAEQLPRVRPLGNAEQGIDLMETRRRSGHIVRVLECEGEIDIGVLDTAFRNMLRRRPILRTQILRPDGEPPFLALDDDVSQEQFAVLERKGPTNGGGVRSPDEHAHW